jgi:hypothetical protein
MKSSSHPIISARELRKTLRVVGSCYPHTNINRLGMWTLGLRSDWRFLRPLGGTKSEELEGVRANALWAQHIPVI